MMPQLTETLVRAQLQLNPGKAQWLTTTNKTTWGTLKALQSDEGLNCLGAVINKKGNADAHTQHRTHIAWGHFAMI